MRNEKMMGCRSTLWFVSLAVSTSLCNRQAVAFTPRLTENARVVLPHITSRPTLQSERWRDKNSFRHSSLETSLNLFPDSMPTESLAVLHSINLSIDNDLAEEIAGPFFGLSLFPYLAFLYFLNVQENRCPKGVTVGFATCLLFVFLSIPAAIAAKILYGVSLADSDWLHGSAESLLTVTNLVTVVAFRQALDAIEKGKANARKRDELWPMVKLVAGLTLIAGATALVPALAGPEVHTPYLGGFLDLPISFETFGANPEPENALTVPCWIIHTSSLVEFLVAMGFCWRWADVDGNPTWKGLTWGLLPLHSSGITASYRIARSNGWATEALSFAKEPEINEMQRGVQEESASLVGFEDLGDALSGDNDYTFLLKLFVGCAVASYFLKYGETFFDFPYDANVYLGISVVLVPSALNAFKWYKRSQDPTFEGWF